MKKVLIYTTLLIAALLGTAFLISLVTHWSNYWELLNYQFIQRENLQVSIIKIVKVVLLYMLFAYVNKQAIHLLRAHYMTKNPESAENRTAMAKNVVQVIVWGLWLLLSLTVLHISVSWLIAITGGLSTGIGFASRNIIENIFYGLSLMTGRIKVGEWIEVNGTMGKVNSISYTSTVVESIYGEIITFQNSQLFQNNYKNLTRNRGYIGMAVPFSVAYGSDLNAVKDMTINAVNKLNHKWIDKSKQVSCVVGELGESSVNLKLFVWVIAPKRAQVMSDLLQCIYNTLRQNNVEIPFPQRDVHVKR